MKKTKQIIYKILLFSSRKLKVWSNKIKTFISEKINKTQIYSLEPKNDLDENDVYLTSLHKALKNKSSLRNIAISGVYGSGKSSIIQSFKKHHPEYNYLDISLPYFTEEEKDKTSGVSKEKITNDKIEAAILQQMFYRMKSSNIPDSRFKRINHLKWYWLFTYVLFSLLWLWGGIGLFYPKTFTAISKINIPWLSFVENNLAGIQVIIFITGVALILRKIFRLFNNTQLKKLNLKNAEIELGKDTDPSVLNKHLDEIIYLFEATNCEVVIFEDLDRFNNTSIFSKLREINFLINSQEKIRRDIVFVYALKDDIFIESERTKFFDYIIPVIPHVNSSNSEAVLLDELGKINVNLEEEDGEKFKDLISDCSLYIKDMRTIYSILNEFEIYKSKINLNAPRKEYKLFALIVYKNLYSSDFSRLYTDDSFLNEMIDKKRDWVLKLSGSKNEDVEELAGKIDKKEELMAKSINELRKLYLYEFVNKVVDSQGNYGVRGIRGKNNAHIQLKDILKDDNFEHFKSERNIQYIYQGTNTTSSGITFEIIEKLVDPYETYNEKEKLIQYVNLTTIDVLKEQLDSLKIELDNIKHWNLREILNEEQSLVIDMGLNNLLLLFLRYGYIDEEYHSYISNFKEGSLLQHENEFVLSVKERNKITLSQSLSNFEKIISKLRPIEFNNKEVLNVELVNYLMQNTTRYKHHIDTLIKQLSNKKKTSLRFIESYRKEGKEHYEFFRLLVKNWSLFWSIIWQKDSKEITDEYLKLILCNADVSDLDNQERLKYSIDKSNNFTQLFTEKCDDGVRTIEEIIDYLDISFKSLKLEGNDDLIWFIYENNYYDINETMLFNFIDYHKKHTKLFKSANYTCIKESSLEDLINYIEENIEEYINTVYLSIETNRNEKEKFLLELLNNENLAIETKEKIIQFTKTKISDLSNSENSEVDKILLEENKVEAKWENIYYCYQDKNNSFPKYLINFINNYTAELLNDKDTQDKNFTSFIGDFLKEDSIEDNSYKELAILFKGREYDLDFINLSKGKISTLIECNLIEFNLANYNVLKSYSGNLHIKFIQKNIEQFDKIKGFDINTDDLISLLVGKRIPIEYQKKLLKLVDVNSVIEDKMLLSIISENMDEDMSFTNDRVLVNKLLKCERVNSDLRTKIFSEKAIIKSKDEVTDFLLTHDNPKFLLITQIGNRPTIKDTELNRKLVEKLKSIGYISNYKIKENGINISTYRKDR